MYPATNINTSVAPKPLYTPQQTRSALNQAVAGAQADAYDIRKRFNNPGFSSGIGTARNMQAPLANSRARAADAMATLPFNDMGANANQLLQGQVARENEAQGWGNLGANNLAHAQQLSNQRQQLGWSLLNQIMGI